MFSLNPDRLHMFLGSFQTFFLMNVCIDGDILIGTSPFDNHMRAKTRAKYW